MQKTIFIDHSKKSTDRKHLYHKFLGLANKVIPYKTALEKKNISCYEQPWLSKSGLPSFEALLNKLLTYNVVFNEKMNELDTKLPLVISGDEAATDRFRQVVISLQETFSTFEQEGKAVKSELEDYRKQKEEELRDITVQNKISKEDMTRAEAVITDKQLQRPKLWHHSWKNYKKVISEKNGKGIVVGLFPAHLLKYVVNKVAAKNAADYGFITEQSVAMIVKNITSICDALPTKITLELQLRATKANWKSLMALIKDISEKQYATEGCNILSVVSDEKKVSQKQIHPTLENNLTTTCLHNPFFNAPGMIPIDRVNYLFTKLNNDPIYKLVNQNYSKQLARSKANLESLNTFLNSLKNYSTTLYNHINELNSKADLVVQNDQAAIYRFTEIINQIAVKFTDFEKTALVLKNNLDEYRAKMEEELHKLADSDPLFPPTEGLKQERRALMETEAWVTHWWVYGTQEGRLFLLLLLGLVAAHLITFEGTVLRVVLAENRYNYALNAAKEIATIISTMSEIREALPEAISSGSAVLLRIRIEASKRNWDSLIDFITSINHKEHLIKG